MRYGLPFKASKNRVARGIARFLPGGETFVDLFAGGCAVTHAAMLSGKWERFIANDIGGWTEVFRDVCEGKYSGYDKVPTREEFFAEKESDPIMKLVYSFGNDGDSYLWGKELEPIKRAASRMLLLPTLHERYAAYHEFIRLLEARSGIGYKESELQNLGRLERLQNLESLERLQSLESLERLQTFTEDYRNVVIPQGAVVYADPPYRGCTDCYGIEFDFDEFDEWVNSVDFPVYISEYTAPKGCVCVAEFVRQGSMRSGGYNVTEKIFLQERFAEQGVSA